MPTLDGTTLTEVERALLDRFVVLAREAFGGDLRAVWLFGSRARGEPRHEESDVDLIVITLSGSSDDQRRVNRLTEAAAEEVGGNPWLVSAHVVDEGWPERRRAIEDFFIAEVDRDKVVVA